MSAKTHLTGRTCPVILGGVTNGRRISPQRIRTARGGTPQAEIAYRMRGFGLKTTERNVRRWETGQTTPHSSVLVPLAHALGVTIDDLFEPDADDEDDQDVLWKSAYELGQYAMADDLRAVARQLAAQQRGRQMNHEDRLSAREIERNAEARTKPRTCPSLPPRRTMSTFASRTDAYATGKRHGRFMPTRDAERARAFARYRHYARTATNDFTRAYFLGVLRGARS